MTMLESMGAGTSAPTAFVHEHVLYEDYTVVNAAAKAGNLPGFENAHTLDKSRLMPNEDPRCRAGEYCPKGPCVVMEMNYLGFSLAHQTFDQKSNVGNLTCTGLVVAGQNLTAIGAADALLANLTVEDILTAELVESDNYDVAEIVCNRTIAAKCHDDPVMLGIPRVLVRGKTPTTTCTVPGQNGSEPDETDDTDATSDVYSHTYPTVPYLMLMEACKQCRDSNTSEPLTPFNLTTFGTTFETNFLADVWSVIPGHTYCGPAAGTTQPFTNSSSSSAAPTVLFPQDRPVASRYSPETFAGIVLPLTNPSRNPNWYYVDGVLGWRLNGPIKKGAPPCYGRRIPRWMFPNTCRGTFSSSGCVNGKDVYGTMDKASDKVYTPPTCNKACGGKKDPEECTEVQQLNHKDAVSTDGHNRQYIHTLVDPHSIGMNGLWAPDMKAWPNGPLDGSMPTDYSYNDSYLHYNYVVGQSKSLTSKKEDWDKYFKVSQYSSVQATGYLLDDFYGLPASGKHGFSRWPEDWGTPPQFGPDNTGATQARVAVKPEGAATTGEITSKMMFPHAPELDPGPQQLRQTPDAAHDPLLGKGLQTAGYLYSHRRVLAFTPAAMSAPRGYDAKNVRVYMHPLFEYLGGIQGPDFFNCDAECLYEIITFKKGVGPTSYVSIETNYVAGTEFDKVQRPASSNSTEGLPPSMATPFGASFINIDQAMLRYSRDHAADPIDEKCKTGANFTAFPFYKPPGDLGIDNLHCTPFGYDPVLRYRYEGKTVSTIGGCDKCTSHNDNNKFCLPNIRQLCQAACCVVQAAPAIYYNCYGNNWTECRNSSLFTKSGHDLFNTSGDLMAPANVDRRRNMLRAISSAYNYQSGAGWAAHGTTETNPTEFIRMERPDSAKAKLAQCLLMSINPCNNYNTTEDGHVDAYTNYYDHSEPLVNGKRNNARCEGSAAQFYPVTIDTIRQLEIAAQTPPPVLEATIACCPGFCSTVHSGTTSENLRSTSDRNRCASSMCSPAWRRYLIPPIEVISEYSKKWSATNKNGLGGRDISLSNHDANKQAPCVRAMRATFAGAYELLAAPGKVQSFLTMDGRLNDHTVKSAQRSYKHVWDGIKDVFTLGIATAVRSITKDTEAGPIGKKMFDETGVDESVCDLAVCDIANTVDTLGLTDGDSDKLLCVPRGYAVARFQAYMCGKTCRFPFANGVPQQVDCKSATGKCEGSSPPEWYQKDAWTTYKDPTPSVAGELIEKLAADQTYPFRFSIADELIGSWKKTLTDYSTAIAYADGSTGAPEFKQTARDAGYSQRMHDNNNNACTCDHAGIVMHTVLVTDDSAAQTWIDAPTTAAKRNVAADDDTISAYYDSTVHAVLRVSLSWRTPRNTALVGLYLGSTSGKTDYVERDVIPLAFPEPPLSARETYGRFLRPGAPSADTARALVYTRVPNNYTIETDHRVNNVTGLRQTSMVHETVAVVPYSCARYPIGMLHRGEMSDEVAAAIYPSNTNVSGNITPGVTTFLANPDVFGAAAPGWAPTLQGYCETVGGKYRFCPTGPHSSVASRRTFCENEPLASAFLTGLKIEYRPLDHRCSDRYKVCILVPGARGRAAAGHVSAQYDLGEGSIGAHVSPQFENYTIMVAPFNQTTFNDVLVDRRATSMFATDDKTMNYMLLDPSSPNTTYTPVPHNDTTYIGFGVYVPFFKMMSNLDMYLNDTNTTNASSAKDSIHDVFTEAFTSIFKNARGKETDGCPTDHYWIPDYDNDIASSRRCAPLELLFPPNPESGITVTGTGITIVGAGLPLNFGGEIHGAPTCTRFLIAAPGCTIIATVDQTNCAPRTDTFHRTPVRLLGKNVDGAVIKLTSKTASNDVVVAVLGKDSEIFPVPTNLSADNVNIEITYDDTMTRASPIPSTIPARFDVACARVYGNITIRTSTPPALVLLQGIRNHIDNNSAPVLALYGGQTDSSSAAVVACTPGDLYTNDRDTCEYVNVTEYTSVFGYGVEHRLFQTGIRMEVYAWVLLIVFSVVVVVDAVLIVHASSAN